MARNRTYEEITVGESVTLSRVVSANDLVVFAHASGNRNPLHVPELDGDGDGQPEAVVPSMWVGSQFSALLGNHRLRSATTGENPCSPARRTTRPPFPRC